MQRGAEFEHQILNALRGVMVQVAGWLIEQYQCRLVDQCPSDGHALSLATGQLRRLVLQAMAEADPLQQSRRSLPRFRDRRAPDQQRHANVLQRGELGKQVEFLVGNATGEMDRSVLERIVAPLEHMLRNAVDHGIESVERRRAAGKSEQGTIRLDLAREGGDRGLAAGPGHRRDRRGLARIERGGGERQRAAIGRALVRQPKVFLFDEPLSNLDAKLRVSTRAQIMQLQRELGTTTVYVTHDQTEAMTMGDRVCVLKKGILQQVDTPANLYDNPGNTFVATFIGSPAMTLIENVPFIEGRAVGGRGHALDYYMPRELAAKVRGDRVIVGVRPENWEIVGVNQPGAEYGLPVHVDIVEHLGSELYIYGHRQEQADELIAVRGDRITVKVERGVEVDQGDTVYLRPIEGGSVFFDPETEINYDYL